MSQATLYCGDALTVLKTLPSESVRCCVTSPPYWGLRDYGTGAWVGGDVSCHHRPTSGHQGRTEQRANRRFTGAKPHRATCSRCGAVRRDQQIGLEQTPEEWCASLVLLFAEVRRVLTLDGTLWLNVGDSYTDGGRGADVGSTLDGTRRNQRESRKVTTRQWYKGLPRKSLLGLPWRLAFALQADGWYLRQEIIWHKKQCMPESVKDRPTRSHEQIFLLAKRHRYYYDATAISEPASPDSHARYARGRSDRHKYSDGGPGNQTIARSFGHMAGVGRKGVVAQQKHGPEANRSFQSSVKDLVERRNARSVWTIGSEPYPGAHFATFPSELARRCVLAGSAPGDCVLDPFGGSGTVAAVATGHGRSSIYVDLNPAYLDLARHRIGPALCLDGAA